MNIKLTLVIICAFVILYPIKAQQQTTIYVKDKISGIPVAYAAYKYNKKTGITNEEGKISIQYNNDTLYISHINYGKAFITGKNLEEAFITKVIYLEEPIISIHPVTIISLHPKPGDVDIINMKSHDFLSHDGGAVLLQSTFISGIKKSGNYGYDPVLRGFKYDQINILMNGSPSTIAACPNRMDPSTSQLVPGMIENIEIYKGPYALRFGNTTGGSINFIESHPTYTNKFTSSGRISGSYETNGTIKRTEGWVGFNTKKINLQMLASIADGSDYQDGIGNEIASGFNRKSTGIKLAAKLPSSNNFKISLINNLARNVSFVALPMDLRKDNTWILNISHEWKSQNTSVNSIKSQYYYTIVNHSMDNLNKNIEPRMMNASTDAITITSGGRSEMKIKKNNNVFYGGIDFRFEEAQGYRNRTFLIGTMAGNTVKDNVWQHATISNSGIFSELQFFKPSYSLIVSARMDINHTNLKDIAIEFDQLNNNNETFQINPALSLGLMKNLSNNIIISSWFARTQRSGSITEKYINYFPVGLDRYEMVGNPKLKPEKNNQFDLNLDYTANRTKLKISLFTSYLNNYISSEILPNVNPRIQNSPGVRQYVNINKALLTGGEISWTFYYNKYLQHLLNIAYTFGNNLSINEPLPEIAPLEIDLDLLGNIFNDKIHPEINFRVVSEQTRTSDEFGENQSPGFMLLNAKVYYHYSKIISCSINIKNLTNTNYYEHLNRKSFVNGLPIYEPGLSFVFTLSVNLTK